MSTSRDKLQNFLYSYKQWNFNCCDKDNKWRYTWRDSKNCWNTL